jgi:aminopeptidase N
MNTNFGKYVYPSYAFIQGGDGGMEYGMCTMILGEAKTLEGLMGLMIHEGSHSWYQQILATNESMRPWMDEGFTSYAEGVVMAQLFPNKNNINPFIGTLNAYRNFVKKGFEEPAVWLGDHHDNGTAYTYSTYVKGELYLVQLGYIMGEQNLKETMLQYYNEWNLKHPTDRDFLHIAQKVSGMDLKWFNNYWINTTKTIDYAIKNVEYGAKSTTITLENKGSVPMPIDFGVQTTNNEVVNFQIPLNMTHSWKQKDAYGTFKTVDYWPWTQKEYKLTIPYTKDQISKLMIDPSQRLADVNLDDNSVVVN